MANVQKAHELVAKAEKKLKGNFLGNMFGGTSKYEDAVELFAKAANNYKLAKECAPRRAARDLHAGDRDESSGKLAAETFVRVAECHKELESIHEMTTAYVEAAHCYKKIDVAGARPRPPPTCDATSPPRELTRLACALAWGAAGRVRADAGAGHRAAQGQRPAQHGRQVLQGDRRNSRAARGASSERRACVHACLLARCGAWSPRSRAHARRPTRAACRTTPSASTTTRRPPTCTRSRARRGARAQRDGRATPSPAACLLACLLLLLLLLLLLRTR
eukprot:scaffold2483_cov287-Prasinococcus_capsulatus_cf.AAC.4